MQTVDYAIIIAYLALLLWLGLGNRLKQNDTAAQVIVGGRRLTLPAFVASLVSTWYGGILGVGEYSYLYGLSNWLVFGLPYYLAAALFALLLAKQARRSEVLTIPERLNQSYGRGPALAGGVIIYLMTVPAAYILMLGVLGQHLFGWPLAAGIILGTAFSVLYVFTGGFRSVVRTDLFQFGLMFLGFIILLTVLVSRYGGLDYLMANLPDTHLTWHGGNSLAYISVWYVIALATMIEPTFHQRCYAAKTESVARTGILISIACWAVFDMLTTSCGLYARALLPQLTDPVASYPALAVAELPPGLLGIFGLALLATVMSTVDSYSFAAATTFGNDIMARLRRLDDRGVLRWTRWGLLLSTLLSVALALWFESVIDIWHVFGSVGTPALLIPVMAAFLGWRCPSSRMTMITIVGAGGVAGLWYLSTYGNPEGEFWLGLQPIFPGLAASVLLWFLGRLDKTRH